MEEQERQLSLNEMLFVALVRDFDSMAMVGFGKIVDPVSQKVERNLDRAKVAIDMLGMLEEKTSGNLNEAELALLRQVLTNLRLNYVDEVGKEKAGGGVGDGKGPEKGAAATGAGAREASGPEREGAGPDAAGGEASGPEREGAGPDAAGGEAGGPESKGVGPDAAGGEAGGPESKAGERAEERSAGARAARRGRKRPRKSAARGGKAGTGVDGGEE